MRILSIGNSFSDDSFFYLGDILRASGDEDTTIGILFVGGCSLEQHVSNILDDNKVYSYHKYENKVWKNYDNYSIDMALKDGIFDVVILQQASYLAGSRGSYFIDASKYGARIKGFDTYIEYLINEIKKKVKNAPSFIFNETWAYENGFTGDQFTSYHFSHDEMLQALFCVYNKIQEDNPSLDGTIPLIEAIECLRDHKINPTRDGLHLSNLGRYVASLVSFRILTGEKGLQSSYTPHELSKEEGRLGREIVNDFFDE